MSILKRISYPIAFLIAFCLFINNATPANALNCTRNAGGDVSIVASCSFSIVPIDGADSGTGSTNTSKITVSAGLLTVTSNQTIATGKLVVSGTGSVANSGTFKIGSPLWMKSGYFDTTYPADEDEALTQIDGTYVRRNTLANLVCDPYAACSASCGITAPTTKPGDSLGNTKDVNNACLSHACPTTAPCYSYGQAYYYGQGYYYGYGQGYYYGYGEGYYYGYGQSYYYGQGYYYGEAYYYGQSYYYDQGYYYAYGQGYYYGYSQGYYYGYGQSYYYDQGWYYGYGQGGYWGYGYGEGGYWGYGYGEGGYWGGDGWW